MSSSHLAAFSHPTYTLRRKVFTLFGGKFHLYDPQGELALFSKLKAFRLKEDIRLYTDVSMQTEVLIIRTQSILDISGTYDVFDPISQEQVGALKRRGGKSLFRDTWEILSPEGQVLGNIVEDSLGKALVRRFVNIASTFMPQAYTATLGRLTVAVFKQNFNPFVHKIRIDFSADTQGLLDRRLGVAAAVLLCAIEGRQS